MSIDNPEFIKLHCGNIGEFDHGAGYGYRCTTCNAVIGSVAEPRACVNARKEVEEKKQVWKILKNSAYGPIAS